MSNRPTNQTGPLTAPDRFRAFQPELATTVLVGLTLTICCSSLATPVMSDSRLVDVLIDSSSGVAIASAPDGRLHAVSTRDGRQVWSGGEGARPLLRVGDRLAAWTPEPTAMNRFRVSWIDPASGATESVSNLVELPDWVSVATSPGTSFQLEPSSDGEDLVLAWRARRWYAGGARPSRQVLEQARRSAEGLVRVDRRTGAVSHTAAPDRDLVASSRPERPFPYRIGRTHSEEAIISGERTSVLSVETVDGESRVLWSSRLGAKIEPGLVLGPAAGIGVLVSLDRRQLFVCAGAGDSCQRLEVYSMEDRRQIANLEDIPTPVSMAVEGQRLFVLVDRPSAEAAARSLQAFDLESGRRIWTVPVQPPPRFKPAR